MRRLIHTYPRLNRAERSGFIVLMTLILFLLSLRMSMHLWVRPDTDPEREAELAAAWKAFLENGKQAESAQRSVRASQQVQEEYGHPTEQGKEEPPAVLFIFDPNTLDSAGFRQLGLRERTTRMLLNWRRKGKRFRVKEDLRPLYSLSEAEYQRLEPYIRIPAANPATGGNREGDRRGGRQDYRPDGRGRQEPVDLNTADSQALVRLRGIGPVLSQKIIARRAALGGFVFHDQLLEIYRFSDTVMELLRGQLIIHPGSQMKININSATEAQLAAHPYIGKSMAARIISFREDLGGFRIIEQLKQVPLMNDEIYRKIALYFTVE